MSKSVTNFGEGKPLSFGLDPTHRIGLEPFAVGLDHFIFTLDPLLA